MANPNYADYLQQGKEVYDPIYKGLETETGANYDRMLEETKRNTLNEYAQRGMVYSGDYETQNLLRQTDVGAKKSGAIANLALQRQQAIEGLAQGRYKNAYDAWQRELDRQAEEVAAQRAYARSANSRALTAADYNQMNQQAFGQGLASLGDWMLATGNSREAAASQLAADTGKNYADALSQVYANYGDGWELGAYKNLKAQGRYKPGIINNRYSKIIAQQLVG